MSTDIDAEYRALSGTARISATTRPHLFYWAGVIVLLGFSALGVWVMTRSVGGGLAIIAVAIVSALLVARPGYWSQKHPDEARHAVDVQRRRRNRLARKHPAYFVVLVPVLSAAVAALRWNSNHHPTLLSWLIPAAAGLLFGAAVGLWVLHRARQDAATSSTDQTT